MTQHGVTCDMLLLLLLLLLCITCGDGFNVVSPRLSYSAPNSTSPASFPFTSESFTPRPDPHPHHPVPKPVDSSPIGNWFRCAPGFELIVFTVREVYTTSFTSDVFDIQTGELIGVAAGNCPDIPGTLSPTGSNETLQNCVYIYTFFQRGMLVATGSYDPSANSVSNNALTGVNGEFFQSLGLEHLRNFPPGLVRGGIQTFYVCEPNIKKCFKSHKHDDDHDEHDGHDESDHYNNHP